LSADAWRAVNRGDLHELREILPNCLRQDRARLHAKLERILQAPSRLSSEHVAHLLNEARASAQLRHRRYERVPPVSYPPGLPITGKKDEIVAAIRAHPVVVIAGETGSGKTTQIPKMCLEAGLGLEGKIGCTQPRRVAALSISRRIAEELKVALGQEVGCKIRFSDRSSPGTYIKLMTDGILLAETQGDRDLMEYDALVIDEAHERSLNIDFLLGHLKLLSPRRPDLKVVITSATIDTEAFSKAFGGAPVIEVSGRTYPVEVRYAPHDADAEERGDLTYIDAAVSAVERILIESERGDVLVFMPSERDIRETRDDLQGRYGAEAEIIPLFGRLTSGEQDRVFAPSARRKIIVSTNIAETSLTIPGVRYVVDTGLARLSRYSPRSRTKRLPIEPISQSSARQRAGRSGRMENGVCVRLYAEEEFAARPKDTQPEIQRANLAEVILKMKAWRLGEMETFPFLNPPQPQAIQGGYQLLQELGALDEARQLTAIGRDLARLPVDPAIGRMILQSTHEGVLPEVLIIAAGLSIQDPRERPLDQQQAADQAHRQFVEPASDFLTLLNVWNAYDAKLESLRTQNQMRKFCRANFLSYTRMREWIDVHAQLEEALEQMRDSSRRATRFNQPTPSSPSPMAASVSQSAVDSRAARVRAHPQKARKAPGSPLDDPRYAAIHRSILTGLLGHVGQRLERNMYRASANRQFMLWPGSSLFERTEKAKPAPDTPRVGVALGKSSQPAWLVSGEIVETSRLFGRTVAGISPEWIVELGSHVCKRTYGSAYWDRRAGRVLARERITLFGLDVQDRPVDFSRIDSGNATALFIRSALMEEDLEPTYRFLEHNRKLRQKLEVWRIHSRNHRLPNLEEALFEFYEHRLEGVSSIPDLNRAIREHAAEPDFLCAQEADFTGGAEVGWDQEAFPNAITLADEQAALEYAYAPGKEHDGVTVKLPVALAHRLDPATLDWIVPGLREEQIEFLLKALPKALRVRLMPIPPKIAELARELAADRGLEGLRELIQKKYGITIPEGLWKRETLPDHLRPRVAITGKDEAFVATGRDLESLKRGLRQHESPSEQQAWSQALLMWERYDVRSWSFGDLPEQIEVTDVAGAMLCAFPGLDLEGSAVHLKLFRNRAEAETATRAGYERLAELALHKEFAWIQRDLRSAFEKMRDLLAGLGTVDVMSTAAYESVESYLIRLPEPLLPLRTADFEKAVQGAKGHIPQVVPNLLERIVEILRLRQEILQHRAFPRIAPAPARPTTVTDLRQLVPGPTVRPPSSERGFNFLKEELDGLVPGDFPRNIPIERLLDWPRYLKALRIRADRAFLNPGKDQDKARQVQPYLDAFQRLSARRDLSRSARGALPQFRWLLEEFKISVFAQELGTAQPVSPKRLEAQLKLITES
jgi:ATP-dependent helicase HrpA